MKIVYIFMQHPSGLTKTVKEGFSWTTLFFGCLPALFRGDLKWALIMFILAWISCGISWFIFPFVYNRLYINELIFKGYKMSRNTGVKAKGLY